MESHPFSIDSSQKSKYWNLDLKNQYHRNQQHKDNILLPGLISHVIFHMLSFDLLQC
ncbi:hypothetical protein [Nitrosopumilus sp.]|uniref:hypothetical protein n=1 Tax=Nitrosopumilus sp. TaxID=2024843 RepID=UPI0034A09A5D